MKATDCKCILCGKQAVAFWPVMDPDIPHHPYCRECLDHEKAKAIANILGVPEEAAKAIVKFNSQKIPSQSGNTPKKHKKRAETTRKNPSE